MSDSSINPNPLEGAWTKGEWVVAEYTLDPNDPEIFGCEVVARNGPEFASVDVCCVGEGVVEEYPELLANARLMAASKDLYEDGKRFMEAAERKGRAFGESDSEYEAACEAYNDALIDFRAALSNAVKGNV